MAQTKNGGKQGRPLFGLSPKTFGQLEVLATPVFCPRGSTVFSGCAREEHLYLVLSGIMRVQQLWETEKEMVLFRVNDGQSCIQTTSQLPIGRRYLTEAIAETDVELFVLPCRIIENFSEESPEMAAFLFDTYSRCAGERLLAIKDNILLQSQPDGMVDNLTESLKAPV